MASDLEKAVSNINDAATKANITTDFFTAVLDGNESQTITNPVSGKSCPSLKKQINDRFTADSSQLNSLLSQATSQADIAKREADRASQISGLDTVADAIGLAAVPFPDVWIPFSDSLRMLAGYGRDVKVGDDVVARYATLTRSTTATLVDKSLILASAAISEARFERDGLRMEQGRTNIVKISETYNPTVSGGVTSVSKSQIMGFNFVKQVNNGSESGQVVTCSDNFDIKAGDKIVYQAVFRIPDSGELAGRFRCRAGFTNGFAFDMSFYNELSNDREPVDDNNKIRKDQPYADKTLVRVIRTITATMDYPGCFFQLQSLQQEGVTNVGCHQIEIASYATSYIPTTNSASTRAADVVTIPKSGNDCAEWYSGSEKITPVVSGDTIRLSPPAGKLHLRNVKGFFTPLTEAQKKGLK